MGIQGRRFIGVVLLSLSPCVPGLAGTDGPAADLLREGRYDQALPVLRKALDEAIKLGDDARTALAWNDLGYLYVMLGRCTEARDSLTRSMRLWENVGSPTNRVRGTSLNLLASYVTCGDGSEAVRLWNRTLKPLLNRADLSHTDSASIFSAGAVAYLSQRQYDLAEPLLTQAIDETRLSQNRADQEALLVLRSHRAVARASLARSQDALDDAEIASRDLPIVGLRPAPQTIVLGNIGLAYFRINHLREAEPYFQQAASLLEHSADSTSGATILENYAGLLRKLHKRDAAKTMNLRSKAMLERLSHPPGGQTVGISELTTFK